MMNLADGIRDAEEPEYPMELLLTVWLEIINTLLFAIQKSKMKNKKEAKLYLLDKIEEMVKSMKDYREDLHMADHE